jgi:ParB family chromosome partitioning protein
MANLLNNLLHNDSSSEEKDRQAITIPVKDIQPSRYQPRVDFDEGAMKDLENSIRENGLIQPVTVRKMDDHYEIIAGERRYRACRNIGMSEISCYVLSPTEDQAAQMALVENVQRQDLSAIEEAKSYVQIMRQSHLTQEQVAQKIGKSQSAVANKIRLLNLPDEIQAGVISGKITERHARALLSAPADKQKKAYRDILKKNLNVKETEVYIEKMNMPSKTHKRQKTEGYSSNIRIGINTVAQSIKMIEKLGIKVTSETEDTPDEVRMVIRFPKK